MAEPEINVFSNTVEAWNQIVQIKEDLNILQDNKTAGAMVRSKANWMLYGEKMSSFFFQLEKYNNKKKTMTKLIKDNGEVITGTKDILQYQFQFYTHLYQQPEMELQPLPFCVHKLLTREERDSINGPLTIMEIDKSLQQMTPNKTPGPNGLSLNFYQKFWNKIRGLLFQVYTISLEEGELHQTAYEGILTLLPKKDRDILRLKNWRPLSMLNNDYKILSKALANRMQLVMPRIIDEEQCGFMKNRFIGDNILSLQSIIQYLHDSQQEAWLMTADLEKAFGLIHHEAIWATLDYFNLGFTFINFVKTLYQKSSVRVLCNGMLSKELKLLNGVKQGDAISSFLFLCATQVLIIALKENPDIQSFEINGVKRMTGLFADDIWNVTKPDVKSLQAILLTYKHFYRSTGLFIYLFIITKLS